MNTTPRSAVWRADPVGNRHYADRTTPFSAKRKDSFAVKKKSMLQTICKWGGELLVLLLTFASLQTAIAVALSYFEWSPFGYEPCGLQAIAWFLIIYPALFLAFLLRAILKYHYSLSRLYLLHPILLGILFLPMAFLPQIERVAISGTILVTLITVAGAAADLLFLKGKSHAENSSNRRGLESEISGTGGSGNHKK